MDFDSVDGAAQQDATPPKEEKKEEQVTLSKAELEGLRRELGEARQSERAWAQLAQRGPRAVPEPAAAEAEETLDPAQFIDKDAADGIPDDTPDKMIEEMAATGVGAFKKRGFITAADAQKMVVEVSGKVAREIVARERNKLTSDNMIVSEFPGLKAGADGEPIDRELFDETKIHYQRAVDMDPRLATSPAALYQAAATARAVLKAKAPARPARGAPDQVREPDDGYDRYERGRQARADAQNPGSRRGYESAGEADDDLIGEEAKSILKQMKVSDAAFLKQKKILGERRTGTGGRR